MSKNSIPVPNFFPANYSPELLAEIRQWGTPWYRAGAIIHKCGVRDESRFLLVHEKRVKIDGVWQDGDGGWNLPCGRLHLKPNGYQLESFEEAAIREVKEESGCVVNLTDIAHIGQRTDADNPYLIIIFGAYATQEAVFEETAEIKETRWFSVRRIEELAREGKLRNADLVQSSVAQFLRRAQDTILPRITVYPSKIPDLPQQPHLKKED